MDESPNESSQDPTVISKIFLFTLWAVGRVMQDRGERKRGGEREREREREKTRGVSLVSVVLFLVSTSESSEASPWWWLTASGGWNPFGHFDKP
jgi:hypothetical protein